MSTKEEKEWLCKVLEGKIKPGDTEWEAIWQREEFVRIRKVLREVGVMKRDALTVDREKMWHAIENYRGEGENRHWAFTAWRWVAAVMMPLVLGSVLWLVSREPGNVPLAQNVQIIEGGSPRAVLIVEQGERIDLSLIAGDTTLNKNNVRIRLDSSRIVTYENTGVMPTEIEYNTIVVPRKGEYQLILADGSKVFLNSESKLRFPTLFIGKERRVYLEGEAYFEVVKDTSKPFIVEAKEIDVRVLGTDFNINAHAAEKAIWTTLVSGKVEAYDRLTGNKKMISPGEQAEWRNGYFSTRKVDVSVYTAWIHGKFYFEGATLEEISTQLQRWYDVDFFFTSESVKQSVFAGVINKEYNINKIFLIIEKTTRVKFDLNGRVVTVSEWNRN